MTYREYVVDRREAGQFLRQYLAARLAVSGRQAKALLDQRDVSVNGRRVWMAGHILQAGDRVGVRPGPASAGSAVKESASRAPADRGAIRSASGVRDRAAVPGPVLAVLYEDADYRVIDKPAGLESVGPGSLEAILQARPGGRDERAAHRLDRDTSGCLMIARHAAAFEAVVTRFRRQDVSKEYRAIVAGHLAGPARTIRTPLDGERAESQVQALGGNDAASLVRVRIITGRTHQIRRHLAGIHHPVLGDRQYGPQRKLDARMMQIPRQMLHAQSLRLPHPLRAGDIRARAPLPPDFRACLRIFGLRDRP